MSFVRHKYYVLMLGYCSNLMAAVSLLAPPPSVGHASTMVEWLGLLDLLELEGKFAGYSLRKIATLWDIELTSVCGARTL